MEPAPAADAPAQMGSVGHLTVRAPMSLERARSIGKMVRDRALPPPGAAKAPLKPAALKEFVNRDAERSVSMLLKEFDKGLDQQQAQKGAVLSAAASRASVLPAALGAARDAAIAETMARSRRASVDMAESEMQLLAARKRAESGLVWSRERSRGTASSGEVPSAPAGADAPDSDDGESDIFGISSAQDRRARRASSAVSAGIDTSSPAASGVPADGSAAPVRVLMLNLGTSKSQQYRSWARQNGMQAVVATSVFEAMAAVQASRPPPLGVTAKRPPGLDVFFGDLAEGPDTVLDVLRQMRAAQVALPTLLAVPPVGSADPALLRTLGACQRLGIDGAVEKPIDFGSLAVRARALAERSRKAQAVFDDVRVVRATVAASGSEAGGAASAGGARSGSAGGGVTLGPDAPLSDILAVGEAADRAAASTAGFAGGGRPPRVGGTALGSGTAVGMPSTTGAAAAAAPVPVELASQARESLDFEYVPSAHVAAIRKTRILQPRDIAEAAAAAEAQAEAAAQKEELRRRADAERLELAKLEALQGMGDTSSNLTARLESVRREVSASAAAASASAGGGGASGKRSAASAAGGGEDRVGSSSGRRTRRRSSVVAAEIMSLLRCAEGGGATHGGTAGPSASAAQRRRDADAAAAASSGWRPAGPAHVFAEVGGYTVNPPPPVRRTVSQSALAEQARSDAAKHAKAVAAMQKHAEAVRAHFAMRAAGIAAAERRAEEEAARQSATAERKGIIRGEVRRALQRAANGLVLPDLAASLPVLPSGPVGLQRAAEVWAPFDVLRGDPREPTEDSLDTVTRAHQIVRRGLGKHRLGEEEEAVGLFTQALRVDPKLRSARLLRGCALFRLSRLEEALADWDGCLAADRGDAHALYNRGLALVSLGDWHGALDALTALVDGNARDLDALQLRGLVHRRMRNYELAQQDYAAIMYANISAGPADAGSSPPRMQLGVAAAAAGGGAGGAAAAWPLGDDDTTTTTAAASGAGSPSKRAATNRRGSVSNLPGKGAFAAAFTRAAARLDAEQDLKRSSGSATVSVADEAIKRKLGFTATSGGSGGGAAPLQYGDRGGGGTVDAASLLPTKTGQPLVAYNKRAGCIGGAAALHSLSSLNHTPAQTSEQLRDVLTGGTDLYSLVFEAPTQAQEALRTPPLMRSPQQLDVLVAMLQGIHFFRGLDGLSQRRFAQACFSREYSEGERLASEGQQVDALFIILAGSCTVKVSVAAGGGSPPGAPVGAAMSPSHAAVGLSDGDAASGAAGGASADASAAAGGSSGGDVSVDTLTVGDVYGHLSLLFGAAHTHTLVARGPNTEAVVLPRSVFFGIGLDTLFLEDLQRRRDLLRRSGAFPTLTDDALLRMAVNAKYRQCRKHTVLLRQGDLPGDFCVLAKGIVHVFKTSDAVADLDARIGAVKAEIEGLRDRFAYHHSLRMLGSERDAFGLSAEAGAAAAAAGSASAGSTASGGAATALGGTRRGSAQALVTAASLGAAEGLVSPLSTLTLQFANSTTLLPDLLSAIGGGGSGAAMAGTDAMGSGVGETQRRALGSRGGSTPAHGRTGSAGGGGPGRRLHSPIGGARASFFSGAASGAVPSTPAGGLRGGGTPASPAAVRGGPRPALLDAAGTAAAGAGLELAATARSGVTGGLASSPASRATPQLVRQASHGRKTLLSRMMGTASSGATNIASAMRRLQRQGMTIDADALASAEAGVAANDNLRLKASTHYVAPRVADLVSTFVERYATELKQQLAELQQQRAAILHQRHGSGSSALGLSLGRAATARSFGGGLGSSFSSRTFEGGGGGPLADALAEAAGGAAAADEEGAGMPSTTSRVLVESLYPPAILSSLAITDPWSAHEPGDCIAETYVELLVISKTQIDHGAFSKAQLSDVAARAPRFPSDAEIIEKARREREWEMYKAKAARDIDKSRWPLASHGLRVEHLPGGKQKLVPVPMAASATAGSVPPGGHTSTAPSLSRGKL